MDKELYDLTYPQKNIWLVEKYNGKSPINLIVGTIEIKDKFDENICKEAINYVVKSNDAMRLRIQETEHEVFQYVDEYSQYNIPVVDLTDYTEDKINEFKSQLSVETIDMINNDLYEFYILKYSKNSGAILMKIHHIISDAWSCSKIGTSIIEYIEAKSNKSEFLEEEKPSYVEYINSEREYENSEKYQKDEVFWRDYLKDIKEPIALKNVSENISKKASRHSIKLTEKENSDINNYCRENRISPYALFLTALSTYLYRIKDNSDFVIGTPVLNRSNFKEKNMMGMFVSTLPLRIKVEENIKFIDFAKQISSNTLTLFRHQKYPYVKTLEYVHQTTDIKSNLYNIVLSYQNARADIIDENLYSTSWLFNKSLDDQLQIHIMDMDNTGILNINYDYLVDLFTKKEIEYLHTRIMAIIQNAISDEEINIENIRIMSVDEERKILYEFNDTDVEYPKDKTVIDLFEEQVEKTPDNIALVFEDKEMTYKELNEKANQLAHYLRDENGIKPNDKICILQKRSFEMLITILGIIKLGACYVPIDIDFPENRIDYMVKNSDAKLLIKSKDIKYENIKNVIIEDLQLEKYDINNLQISVDGDNLVYIIYTSGTTGKPKGVMITHSNLLNLCYAATDFQDLKQCDIWGAFSTYSFDISILETLVPFSIGKKVIIATEEEQKMPDKMYQLIIKNNIEVVYMTPTRMHLLINYDTQGEAIKCFKRVLLGGEEFPENYYEIIRKFSDAKIYDGYGPTEITVWSSAKEIQYKENINIGKSIPNVTAYILDNNNKLLPIGCKGELCVGGRGVAAGYYSNEELTRLKFVDFNGNKIYKTGDIAYFNFDGELVFVGRKDTQIKLHGLRIEISEIESAIKSFDNIIQAVVVVRNEKIYAYFSSDKYIAQDELKKYLKSKLPRYMVPTFYMQVKEFEFTVLGKIDKTKLPEIKSKDVEFVAPRNELDIKLRDSIIELLKINNLGIEDNLFEIGLDSLNAISLIAELSRKDIKITYGNLYDYQTIKELSNYLESNNEKNIFYKLDDYDYKQVTQILSNNKLSNIDAEVKKNDLGNILIAGVTGFLGIHILDNFLENERGNVYCFIRKKDRKNPTERLIERLKFYFNGKYIDEIGKRIFIIEGDIGTKNFTLSKNILNELIKNVNTVINAASRVKHFGNEEIFKKINVESSKNIADFCFENKKKLIYISTLSVSGNSLEGGYVEQDNISQEIIYDESKLFVNQKLNNIYIYTKFLAERYLLEMKQKGLDLKIMRIGNLTGRWSDNKFQINDTENAFANRLRALIKIKVLPNNLKDFYLEFTPVDVAANAIVNLSKLDTKYLMFHLFNHKHVYLDTFIRIMKKNNLDINFISESEFSNVIDEYINSEDKVNDISGILIDLNKNNELKYKTNITIKSDYTTNLLEKIGIKWPELTDEYIIEYMKKL